jgi:hypothetical protein
MPISKAGDKEAKIIAKDILANFWEDFDRTLGPRKASKQMYKEMLEQLAVAARLRLECVENELVAKQAVAPAPMSVPA